MHLVLGRGINTIKCILNVHIFSLGNVEHAPSGRNCYFTSLAIYINFLSIKTVEYRMLGQDIFLSIMSHHKT